MKKSIVTLAFLIALMPQLGFPELWKNIFITAGGLLIILLVLIPRREKDRTKIKGGASFVENGPAHKEKEQIKIDEETVL
ncbi:MAG: hypothetical protein WCT49_02575 [Candidatus Paceibacterota bacterium]|jgi:hypothetical protein|nr:hypothetical protein [Candidatus Paceibacterota bacterium]